VRVRYYYEKIFDERKSVVKLDDKPDVEEIIERGKSLSKLRANFSSKDDFETYIEEKYHTHLKRAQGWIRIAKRFAEYPDLVKGLCETNIVTLANSALEMADVVEIITKLSTGEIESDTRSVKQSVCTIIGSHFLEDSEEISVDQAFNTPLGNTPTNTSLNEMLTEHRRRLAILRIEKPNIQKRLNEVEAEEKLQEDIISYLERQQQRVNRRNAFRAILRIPHRLASCFFSTVVSLPRRSQ
jgi:hypothetical protein